MSFLRFRGRGPLFVPGTYSYATWVGQGVSSAGVASLPLRSGAQRFFVNNLSGAGGSDSNAGTSPSAPLLTEDAANTKVVQGRGDQILMAQGGAWSAGLSNLTNKDGYNPQCPTVIQSYDPSDPLNESKYGTATGSNRPRIFTAGGNNYLLMGGGTAPNYIAIRGLKWDCPNQGGNSIVMTANTVGATQYLLMENNELAYTATGYNAASGDGTRARCHIWRGNSFYGAWATNGFGQALYLGLSQDVVLEDNFIFHSGWRIGAARGEGVSTGGGSWFAHAVYAQDDVYDMIARRNFVPRSISETMSCRGDIVFDQNVGIGNSVAVGLGSGTGYASVRPSGVNIIARYNAFLGSGRTPTPSSTSGSPSFSAVGWGMSSCNGTPGSYGQFNLLARSDYSGDGNRFTFMTEAHADIPSYMAWNDNLAWNWSLGDTVVANPNNQEYPAQVFGTYARNKWEQTASGTNTDSRLITPPNPYTEAELAVLMGYIDPDSMYADLMSNPQKFPARSALQYLQAGYGIDNSGMVL